MTIDADALRERLIGGLYDQQVDVGRLCDRHRRSIDAAIEHVVDELARAYVPAERNMGLAAWLRSDDTCPASVAIVRQWHAIVCRRGAAAQHALAIAVQEPDDVVAARQRDVDYWRRERERFDGVAIPVPRDDSWPAPTGAAALRRCLACLDAVPQLRDALGELALRSTAWAAFVAALPAMEATPTDHPNYDGALLFALRAAM